MDFERWMQQQGLSPSSIKKYAGAIRGPLSEWALNANLITEPLDSHTHVASFHTIALALRLLPTFQERNERGHHMYSSALNKFGDYLAALPSNNLEIDIDEILDDSALSNTERHNLLKCRIGQGSFRQKLITYWQVCAVTGYPNTNLLIASHIKPWRESNHSERLNPFNGLLLTPNLDKAFDTGLITFSQDGSILLSSHLSDPTQLGITPRMRISLHKQHQPFMDFHRANVFKT